MTNDIPAWLRDWLHAVTLWDIVLWVVAAAAIVLFVKRGWPALKKFAARLSAFIRTVDAIVGLADFIKRTDATLHAQNKKIAEIHHETHNNNGSSVKDSVDRIELGVKGLYDRTDRLESSLEGVHGRLDEVERGVGDLASADAEIRERAAELRQEFDNTHPKAALDELGPTTNGDTHE